MLNSIGEHLVAWAIIIPFSMGVLTFLLGQRLRRGVAAINAILMGVISVRLGLVVYASGSIQYEMGGWSSPLGISLYVNGLSAIMLIFTALVGTCVSIYSWKYFGTALTSTTSKRAYHAEIERYFWPIWLFAWGGLNVLFLSGDIFNIYVALEIISFSAVGLVALKGTVDSLLAATRYFFLSLIASLVYLLGVSFIYSHYGVLDINILQSTVVGDSLTGLALVLMTLGLMIKTALFPMHFWLPKAHANSPAPVSAALSGLVVMGAFYLAVRFWSETFNAVIDPVAGLLLGLLASVSIIGGSIMALRQKRLKMMLAYSTIAQMGYMFLLFPLVIGDSIGVGFAWSGGIYFSIAHACAKASAFMVAGSIIYSLGHDRIDDLGGLARSYPLGVFTFALAGTSLMGLPPSGGFIGKWMLLKASMLSGQWWYAVLMLIGSILSACYIFRFLEVVFQSAEDPKVRLDIPASMKYSALSMACAAIIMGFIANVPFELLKIGSPFSFPSMEGFIR